MNRSTIILIAVAILAAGAFFAVGYMSARHKYDRPVDGRDTVLVEKWVRDTIYQPKDSLIVKWKTAYLPVHDTTFVHDTTTVKDSVLVDIPITEKHYASENYRATVRGYNPELVDIWIKQTERTITVPYRKHWSFTVGPQVGYGFTPQGWQPYAGAGVSFGYSF